MYIYDKELNTGDVYYSIIQSSIRSWEPMTKLQKWRAENSVEEKSRPLLIIFVTANIELLCNRYIEHSSKTILLVTES